MNELFDLVFGYLCHQDPERTIWVEGEDLTLCWRCAGLHLGVAVFWFLGLLQRKPNKESILNNGTWPFLLGPAIMYLHWYLGSAYHYQSAGYERFIVGWMAGGGFGIWLQVTARSVGLPKILRAIPTLFWILLMISSILADHQGGTGPMDGMRTIMGASSVSFILLAIFAGAIMIPAQLWTGARMLYSIKRKRKRLTRSSREPG